MFHIVLFNPEIPPNTGNVIRLAANTGCQLHLVEPLGFPLEDAKLRRAGLDYHEYARMQVHPNWASCKAALGERRCFAFTTKGSHCFSEVAFQPEDVFVFGPETRGLPAELLQEFAPAERLRLPMLPTSRSMNLSNTVAITVFEAWRQHDFGGHR
ncbi:tRNA (cytidine(34)-2'-O)-methyltransferase [Leeia sp.]|uniref:tRNA (cytidine(34)-2'-O)-methyltransferase n=1 Tax=Leeia sp. TaxID=2884678 RepID=UPI0035AFD901